MHWWYERGGQRCGPVNEAELLALVVQGTLTATALVWRDGLPEWTRLQDIPTLAAQLPAEPPALPPPLPTRAPSRPNSGPGTTRAVSSKSVVDTELADDRVRNDQSVANKVTAPATWYRFFARQIDTCLLAIPVVVLGGMAIGELASPAFAFKLQDREIGSLAAILLLCLFGPLAEASTARVFGNTPGKVLFGLKVYSLEGRPLTFGEHAKRAYRVMASGLGFYIPLVTVCTAISQFRLVKKSGSASYDVGKFRVHERNLSRPRKFMAVSMLLLVIFAWGNLEAYYKYESTRIATPKPWTNPETRMTTTIPSGWVISSDKNEEGQVFHSFTKADDAIQVLFASEAVPQTVTLEAYVEAFVRVVRSNMTITPNSHWTIVAGHEASEHNGTLLSPETPIEVTFVKSGNTVWRTIAIRYDGVPVSLSPTIDELRTAVLMSVPKQ